MLARKDQQQEGNHFPLEWQQKVETLLFEIYGAQCKKDQCGFQVHGLSYHDEVFLAVSYVNLKSPTATPFTYMVSADLDDKNDPLKTMESLVDSVGSFFDQLFLSEEWEIDSSWRGFDYQGRTLYARTSRENISLTIEADRILKESGDLE